jgi:hypothetical protein
MSRRANILASLDESQRKDKTNNPVIAIPGSPGIGKSTFMNHFPRCNEYQSFTSSRGPLIVAPFTFNRGMSHGERNIPAVGLRMLYGAACVMTAGYMSWKIFYEQFKDHSYLQASSAVEVLRRVFGESRPVLILADEISKAVECDEESRKKLSPNWAPAWTRIPTLT